jgi:putative transposase
MLQSFGIKISLDGIGRCLDDIFIERTFRTLKYECIFLHDYATMTVLSNRLKDWTTKHRMKCINQDVSQRGKSIFR